MKYGRDYETLFERGTKAQLEKLVFHKTKPDFRKIDIDWAVRRCGDEVIELTEEAMMDHVDYQRLRLEAADVANFAHMIILECDRRLDNAQTEA